MKIEKWSATSVSKSQSCLRLLKHEKIDRYIPRDITGSAIQGILTHVGVLENCLSYQGAISTALENWEPPEADIWNKATELEKLHEIKVSRYDIERSIIYTNAFSKTSHFDRISKLQILYVEHKFEVELLGHKFTGVFDAVGYDPETETHYIIELKTTGSDAAMNGSKTWWESKLMANQPVIYISALREMIGKDANIVMLYNVIKTTKSNPKLKPGTRRKKDESKEDYEIRKADSIETLEEWTTRLREEYQDPSKFTSDTVVFMDSQIESRMKEIGDIIKMVDSQTSFPRNPGNCGSFGGCAFMNVCLGLSSLETDSNLIKLEDKSKVQEVPF